MGRHGNAFRGLVLLIPLLFAACANMGRPEGGPKDENPPVFISSSPAPGSVNVDRDRLSIVFDENVQLEDAFTKVVVSPPQKTPPTVSANGRRVSVTLRDSLRDSTTYTIDFADAIKDLNEGNVLDGFAIDFSTGPSIDTLRISGTVLEARNLEPAQGMLVGVYRNFNDTTIRTLPMERIARTNQLGQFTVRNLPEGSYRIFAINDVNRDYHWDRSEDIAFLADNIVPTTEAIEVTDTLFASDGSDSLMTRPGVRYLPNDLLLTWFNQGYSPQYLDKYSRPERRKIVIKMSTTPDTLPSLTIVEGSIRAGLPDSLWALRQMNEKRDSLIYWIADSAVYSSDSLRMALRYLKTDSTDTQVWTNDTLRFFFKDPPLDKKEAKRRAKLPKFRVDTITGDTIPLPPPDMEYLGLSVEGSRPEINKPLILKASLPWASLDTTMVRFNTHVDTIWQPAPFVLEPDSLNPLMDRVIRQAWTPGAKYKLEIDSLAAKSIYGSHNKDFVYEFTAPELEEYSNLRFTIPGTDTLSVVVELLTASDAVFAKAVKAPGTENVDLRFITPGTYYARLFIDENNNGEWDTGSIDNWQQPEDVYYFAKKLTLKKNWDIEQVWQLDELTVDMQKPLAIKKNKPKLKRGEKEPVSEEDEWEQEEQNRVDPFTPVHKGGNKTRRPGMQQTGTNVFAR